MEDLQDGLLFLCVYGWRKNVNRVLLHFNVYYFPLIAFCAVSAVGTEEIYGLGQNYYVLFQNME